MRECKGSWRGAVRWPGLDEVAQDLGIVGVVEMQRVVGIVGVFFCFCSCKVYLWKRRPFRALFVCLFVLLI
jgi:hypothetical protein